MDTNTSSHPFGELLSQHLGRKRSLNQSKLAAAIQQEPAIITKMCKGQRLNGPQARERVLAVIAWLHFNGVLRTTQEANALLRAADMAVLRDTIADEKSILDAIRAEEPSSPPLNRLPTIMPTASTPFVGRTRDVQDVCNRLADARCRLLTIAGPGGVGKTRLAIEVGRIHAERSGIEAVFVDLQPVISSTAVPFAIAGALGIALSADRSPIEQLAQILDSRQLLLIIDNFEHLADSAGDLSVMLNRSPGVKLLVTSRESLSLAEEWLFRISGISYEVDLTGVSHLDAIPTSDAACLFISTAHRVQPQFDANTNADVIDRICRLTEGMPLAIEIAAAWTRVLPCKEIAIRLTQSLRALNNTIRNAPSRHKSIEVAFDHSWRLLDESSQRVFCRLSVFQGSFSLDSAVAVAGADITTLSSLVDKSMLQFLPDGRYKLHELLRQYGAERLNEIAEEHERMRHAHGMHFMQFLAEKIASCIPGKQLAALALCRPDMDNLLTAWQWAIQSGQAEALGKAAAPLCWILQYQNRYLEMVQIMQSAFEALPGMTDNPAHKSATVEILVYYAWSFLRLGRLDTSEKMARLSLDTQTQLKTAPSVGWANDSMTNLSIAAAAQGDFPLAKALATEAIQRAQQTGQVLNEPVARYAYANAALALGDPDSALTAIQEAILICEQFGEKWFLAYALNTLGDIEMALGRLDDATSHYQRAFDMRALFGDREGMAVALNNLGDIALLHGDAQKASASFEHSKSLYRNLNDNGGIATAIKGLGETALLLGDYLAAETHLAAALSIARQINYTQLVTRTLVSTAMLFYRTDRKALAVELLRGLAHHPTVDEWCRKRARRFMIEHDVADAIDASTVDWRNWIADISSRTTAVLSHSHYLEQSS